MISGGSRIQVEHIVDHRIPLDAKNVGMTADENVGFFFGQYFFHTRIVVGWCPANMSHPYGKSFAGKPEVFRKPGPKCFIINVSKYGTQRSEFFQLIGYSVCANVTGVPELVAFFEWIKDGAVQVTVSVGKQTDFHKEVVIRW